MNRKVLVIAVHPDDETLGCGGTILKYKNQGAEVHWLICSESKNNAEFHSKRKKEIEKVASMFSFDSVINLQLEATKIDNYSMSTLVEKISNVINKLKPDTIFIPFRADVHSDHRSIFEASISCTKSFRYPFIKRIYMMETLSETEFSPSFSEDSFTPNTFVDISDYMNTKIQIMKTYEGEILNHPFPRSEESIKALGLFRGGTCGCKYAESFVLLKEIC